MNIQQRRAATLGLVALAMNVLACSCLLQADPTPTPYTIPDSFTYVEEPTLGLSFIAPADWERIVQEWPLAPDNDDYSSIQYYTTTSSYPLSIQFVAAPEQPLADNQELYALLLHSGRLDSGALYDIRVLEDIPDLVVDGQPAFGFTHIEAYPRPPELYCISITFAGPDDRAYVVSWSAREDYEGTVKSIYETMIGTIRFLD
ncbi:MAG: hypothetical protein E3J64_09960 [Anaerolineales bacterium]|nr:MAG: hypothetical protein E3J64_09960 [Anaerolineales bacterium]